LELRFSGLSDCAVAMRSLANRLSQAFVVNLAA